MTVSTLTTTPAWKSLEAHAAQAGTMNISALFKSEADRTDAMMLPLGEALFDFSKNLASKETVSLLVKFAEQQNVSGWFARMMKGENINNTEGRAVLHTALRQKDAPAEVKACLASMKAMADRIRADKDITDVVHIGIGGSDLGPRMVCDALANLYKGPRVHFVANVDPDDLDQLLEKLNPAHTMITVASKTFTTQETMTNFKVAREWLGEQPNRVIALTSNVDAAAKAGISEDNVLPMWDWVGGRFSVCSSVGLPIAIAYGYDAFAQFLAGCEAADSHVASTPYARNVPVMMALLSVWYRNFLGYRAQAIVPYSQRLARFSDYMQQLEMESNGKRVDRDGKTCNYATAPVIFGQAGTNGQHAFFQMLHQGPDTIPVDFIGAKKSQSTSPSSAGRHEVLIKHMFAQSRALMVGRQSTPEKTCPGNRPSNTIMLPKMDAFHIGMILAVYEHKTAAEGFLWNLNSFDQFGVELGKELAKELLAPANVIAQNEDLDISTNKLIIHTFSTK